MLGMNISVEITAFLAVFSKEIRKHTHNIPLKHQKYEYGKTTKDFLMPTEGQKELVTLDYSGEK